MTSADRNYDDLVPAQEKLEWVTPQMRLMGTDDTERKVNPTPEELGGANVTRGPS